MVRITRFDLLYHRWSNCHGKYGYHINVGKPDNIGPGWTLRFQVENGMKQRVIVFVLAILLVTLLISCIKRETAGTGAVVISIEGPKWRLVEVSESPVSPRPGERRPFITFDATNKQASGFAGCNNFFGSYELDGSSLKFGPVGATRMFCEGAAGEIEMRFMESLEQTRTWELRDGALLLLDGSKELAWFTTEE